MSISDGTSNTILIGHISVATGDYQVTTPANSYRVSIFLGGTPRPRGVGHDGVQDTTSQTTTSWGSPMKEGGLMVMADGSVHLFRTAPR